MTGNNKWTTADIPDQQGKVVVITGADSGIGFEAARVLAEKNATVIAAARNQNKGEKAVQKIKDRFKDADVTLMLIDLASLDSVKKFAEVFKKKYERLDILINNAGVMVPPYSKTEEGFELQFGVNHLGHFALTALLFDLIKTTPNSRIVNVSSNAHKMGNINFEDLNWEKRKYKASRAYGDSKLANLYFTYELSDRMKKNDLQVKVTAAHPGWTATNLQRHSSIMEFMNKIFAMSVEKGTLPILRAAVDKNADCGDFFGPDGFMEMTGYPARVDSNKLSHNKELAEKLWEVSEKMTNINFNLD